MEKQISRRALERVSAGFFMDSGPVKKSGRRADESKRGRIVPPEAR